MAHAKAQGAWPAQHHQTPNGEREMNPISRGKSSAIKLSSDVISIGKRQIRDAVVGGEERKSHERLLDERDPNVLSKVSKKKHCEKSSQTSGRLKWSKLYAMHFLFLWTSQSYEYASIFLVGLAFSRSFTATSLRLASTFSALICSSAVGSWVDQSPYRLRTLKVSVSVNHATIMASYIFWLLWQSTQNHRVRDQKVRSLLLENVAFSSILFLDIMQNLSAITYRLCMERDWVPVLVNTVPSDAKHELVHVNSVMMRIELLCNFMAPSLQSLPVRSVQDPKVWMLFLVANTLLSLGLGLWLAHSIARENVQFQLPKQIFTQLNRARDFKVGDTITFPKLPSRPWLSRIYRFIYRDPLTRLQFYFSSAIWPASLSVALLQLTILASHAHTTRYLENSGSSMSTVTMGRNSEFMVQLAGTILTPLLVLCSKKNSMRNMSKRCEYNNWDEKVFEGTITRMVGFWVAISQFLCMIPPLTIVWVAFPTSTVTNQFLAPPPVLVKIAFFGCLSLSHICHSVQYLMIRYLGQVEVPVSQRCTFAGVEQSFKALSELSYWLLIFISNKPEDYGWLAISSLLITGLSVGIYAWGNRKVLTAKRIWDIARWPPLVDL